MTNEPKTHHVVPSPEGGWNECEVDPTVPAAIHGREISRNQGIKLRIHNRNGQITNSNSHGKDSFLPRG